MRISRSQQHTLVDASFNTHEVVRCCLRRQTSVCIQRSSGSPSPLWLGTYSNVRKPHIAPLHVVPPMPVHMWQQGSLSLLRQESSAPAYSRQLRCRAWLLHLQRHGRKLSMLAVYRVICANWFQTTSFRYVTSADGSCACTHVVAGSSCSAAVDAFCTCKPVSASLSLLHS